MIRLIRDNKEVRKTVLLQTVLAVISSAVCFCFSAKAGMVAAVFSFAVVLTGVVGTYRRYRNIASLARDINGILHGENGITFEEYSEGELSILCSEIHKMTVRLREQQHKLTEDKVYLSDSIADISHQLRTPLTSINLLVSLLSEPDMSTERRSELTHELYSLLSRIEWLITTLLKISKLDTKTVVFKKETVGMDVLVNKACLALFVPVELKGQELSVKTEGCFTGDTAWTAEAIGNIVKNCVEHTPVGGKIEIEARDNPLFSEITVSDNGNGIPKEDIPYIFDRFYKGSNSDDRSFGIGLALARMIITEQNGTIKAENGKESGARFTVRFYKGTV